MKVLYHYVMILVPRCNGVAYTDWSCCTPGHPCGEGEGDCDRDDDCAGTNLKCGYNNCREDFADFFPNANYGVDCCYGEIIMN